MRQTKVVVTALFSVSALTGCLDAADSIVDPPDSSIAVTEIPALEHQALVALYESTNGAGWINNMGWVDDFPELEKPKRERQHGNIAHREWTGFEWNKGHD